MKDDFGTPSRNSSLNSVGTAANFFFMDGTGLHLL
jgi:hypothetical protein